ncbi:MAG: hypothetical protein J6Y82_02605 [Bacteroidales bacterium]|nr:hypothetical protein [Bacteroidales bacterium]
MADNYLERKFEEHYSQSVAKRRPTKRIKVRRALVFGLPEPMAQAVSHSLRMLGHTVVVADALTESAQSDYDIFISSAEKADECAAFLQKTDVNNCRKDRYSRFVVVGRNEDWESIKVKFTGLCETVNCISFNQNTDCQNIAKACRIFISDENSFINGNVLCI